MADSLTLVSLYDDDDDDEEENAKEEMAVEGERMRRRSLFWQRLKLHTNGKQNSVPTKFR